MAGTNSNMNNTCTTCKQTYLDIVLAAYHDVIDEPQQLRRVLQVGGLGPQHEIQRQLSQLLDPGLISYACQWAWGKVDACFGLAQPLFVGALREQVCHICE